MDKKYESFSLIKNNLLMGHNFFWLQMSAKNERRSSNKSASASACGIFFKMLSACASESAVFWDQRKLKRNVF